MIYLNNQKEIKTVEKKYEFTSEFVLTCDAKHTLHRIRALVDIPRHGVKAGDIGGYLESESNLLHKGDCWVGGAAMVFENARVTGNALVDENAVMRGTTAAWDNVHVYGNALMLKGCFVFEDAKIYGHAVLDVGVQIDGDARICGTAHLADPDLVVGNGQVIDK